MKIIAAGFQPFEGRRLNRSERAVRRLRDLPDVEIVTLPVSFARIADDVARVFEDDPDVVVLAGESRAARTLLVERIALNLADARVDDNAGARPRGVRLDPAGPLAREVSFDVNAVVDALRAADVPAQASAHAGTFLCNAALYFALGRATRSTVAFVHVPAKKRFLGAQEAARGLGVVIHALVSARSRRDS